MSKTIETNHTSWEIGGGKVNTRSYMNEIRNVSTNELMDTWIEVIEEPTEEDCWDGDDFQLG